MPLYFKELSKLTNVLDFKSDKLVLFKVSFIILKDNVSSLICETVKQLGLSLPKQDHKWYGEPDEKIHDEYLNNVHSIKMDELTSIDINYESGDIDSVNGRKKYYADMFVDCSGFGLGLHDS